MIRIVCDGEVIYSPNLVERGFVVYNPVLKLGFGKADVLTFVLPPNSQGYNKIHNLSSTVVVYDDDAIRFVGRALKIERDFYNNRSVYCEGGIAWLNDSVQEPFDFQDTSDSGYANFWNKIITAHNSQVSDNRKFVIVPPDFQSPYTRSVEDYVSTYDLCLSVCEDSGAVISVGYAEENGVITTSITLKKNWPRGNQKIKFGQNLLDIEEHLTAQNVYTVIVPVGTDRLTIESVNDGKNYIESESGISVFGRIVKTVFYGSVSVASDLKEKGQADLDKVVQEALTLKFDAVDLKRAGYNTDTILTGNWYHVESPPHGMDEWYQCSTVELDLVDPSKSKYAFGAELTGGAVISVATAKATEKAQELAEKAESVATSAQTSANTALNNSEQLVLDDSTIADDYNRYLSRVGNVNRVFIAHASYWLDTPDSRSGVFTTQRYSTNYALQTFVSADGACDMWHRIVRIDGSEVDAWVKVAGGGEIPTNAVVAISRALNVYTATRATGNTFTFDIPIADNLITNSSTDCLSAKQGKVLQDGKVSKPGDTMTGALTITNQLPFQTRNTGITAGAVTDNIVYGAGINCLDNDMSLLCYFRPAKWKDGGHAAQIETRKVINGTPYYNTLCLTVKPDGTREVQLSHPDAWRSALGVSELMYWSAGTYTATVPCFGWVDGDRRPNVVFVLPKHTGTRTIKITKFVGTLRCNGAVIGTASTTFTPTGSGKYGGPVVWAQLYNNTVASSMAGHAITGEGTLTFTLS